MSARYYRPELDALRFGAFLLVFLHHALPHASGEYSFSGAAAQALAALARAGALGVDLFFALSSYLITQLLLREHGASGTMDIRAFYVRRILRIWPLYYTALFLLAPALAYLRPGDALPAGHWAGFALLSGNWVCAFGGYPASSFALLWSVSIEEQFYLVWPWLIRGKTQRIAGIALGMVALGMLTRVTLAALGVSHPGVWTNTLARLDPIAGGALLAVWNQPLQPRIWLAAGGLVGLLGIGGIAPHDGWSSVASYPLAAACAVAILAGVIGAGQPWRPLVYLGKISFGLYVFHAAAIELAGPWWALPWTIAAAVTSYRVLELPFLRWKDRIHTA